MTPIDRIIEAILVREGSKFTDDPTDQGGPTKFGITLPPFTEFLGREATVEELRKLTEATATQIYRDLYVIKPMYHRLVNEALRALVVDSGVLHGRGWTTRRLQEVVGATADGTIGPLTLQAIEFADKTNNLVNQFTRRRIHRIGRIVQRRPSQIKYVVGWLDRATAFLVN